jgi:acyl-CoA dehydrogenase
MKCYRTSILRFDADQHAVYEQDDLLAIGPDAAGREVVKAVGACSDLVGRFAAKAIVLGRVALKCAARYAQERVVFDRPIGMNQGIQHPLAERWMELEAAQLLMLKAAWLYDRGDDCAAEANAAKYLGAEAGFRACETAVLTHGGMGYAKEYHVERYLREAMLPRIAPVSPQLIFCFIAEKVLGLPKSY